MESTCPISAGRGICFSVFPPGCHSEPAHLGGVRNLLSASKPKASVPRCHSEPAEFWRCEESAFLRRSYVAAGLSPASKPKASVPRFSLRVVIPNPPHFGGVRNLLFPAVIPTGAGRFFVRAFSARGLRSGGTLAKAAPQLNSNEQSTTKPHGRSTPTAANANSA